MLTDYKSYIISGRVSESGLVEETLCINLFGYYIEIDSDTSIIPEDVGSSTKVYIAINLTDETDIPSEINGEDNGEKFTGIELITDISGKNEEHVLLLLNKLEDKWYINTGSYFKFNPQSIFSLDEIDGNHPISNTAF